MCCTHTLTHILCMYITCTHSDDDAGSTLAVKSPTLRAVGLTVLTDRVTEPREVTCILCQADGKDSDAQDKAFVQAVCVQRSCALRRGIDPSDIEDLTAGGDVTPSAMATSILFAFCLFYIDFDYLTARADHPLGVYTSGCGHHMHAECWKRCG